MFMQMLHGSKNEGKKEKKHHLPLVQPEEIRKKIKEEQKQKEREDNMIIRV